MLPGDMTSDLRRFQLYFQINYFWIVCMFLPICFQGRLLQICCTWERVKGDENIVAKGEIASSQ